LWSPPPPGARPVRSKPRVSAEATEVIAMMPLAAAFPCGDSTLLPLWLRPRFFDHIYHPLSSTIAKNAQGALASDHQSAWLSQQRAFQHHYCKLKGGDTTACHRTRGSHLHFNCMAFWACKKKKSTGRGRGHQPTGLRAQHTMFTNQHALRERNPTGGGRW
jgi:hypothetical protein